MKHHEPRSFVGQCGICKVEVHWTYTIPWTSKSWPIKCPQCGAEPFGTIDGKNGTLPEKWITKNAAYRARESFSRMMEDADPVNRCFDDTGW